MNCPHCLESFHDEHYDSDLLYRGNQALVEAVPDKRQGQTRWGGSDESLPRMWPGDHTASVTRVGSYQRSLQSMAPCLAKGLRPRSSSEGSTREVRRRLS